MTIELAAASQHLADLVARVQRGEEVVLTQCEEPVAVLSAPNPPVKRRRIAGRLKGEIWMSDDFDEPLEDMKPYME